MRTFIKNNFFFSLVILLVVIFRFELSFLPAFEIDQSAYRYFSARLVNVGIKNYYSPKDTNLNALGYFYPLWIVGLAKNTFFPDMNFYSKDYDMLLKIPANLADIATGLLIYSIVKKRFSKNWGILGFSMYVFNPAIFFNSSIWGQYDSISTFFLLLALRSIIKKNTLLMASFFAIALSFKPQAVFFAPIAVTATLIMTRSKQWVITFCSFAITTLLIYLPFFPRNPFYGIYFVNSNLVSTYTCTSCFAFNFWGIFGNWQNDLNLFLGFSKIYWGIILLALFLFMIFFKKAIRMKFQFPYIFFTTAISVMVFYIFLTRMHDRYIFALFPFLLLAAIFLKSKMLTFFYFFISTIHFLNLYYVYIYYNVFYHNQPTILFNKFLYEIVANNFSNFSLVTTVTFLCMILIFNKFVYKTPSLNRGAS